MNSQIRDLKKKGSGGVVDDAKLERIVERAVEKQRARDSEGVVQEVTKLSEEINTIKQRTGGEDDEKKQYWFARRSVRCWPITGSGRNELLAAVGDFFGEKLGISPSSISEGDIEEVRKLVPRARKTRESERVNQVRDEVLVVLKEVQTRDMIFKHASNLTAWRDSKKPNALGIRLQIPTFLLGKFNTLHQHGFDLRKKYGAGLKRHIRFNDGELDLVMDVKLPQEEDWIEVDYDFALEETKMQRRNKMGPRGRLSSLGEVGRPPRETSETEAPLSAPPMGVLRRGEGHELTTVTRTKEGVFQWGKNV